MAARRGLSIAAAAAWLGACLTLGAWAAPAPTTTEISGKGSQLRETALGDLVADAVRASAKAQVSLLPAVWLREAALSPGPVEPHALRALLAFPDDQVAVLSLRGDALAATLERGVALVPRPNKGFLQVSGVSVKFDRRQPSEARVKEILIGKERLDPAKVYKVAAPLPLAKGALGYFRVFNGAPLAATDVTVADALARYLTTWDPASLKVGERLRDLAPPPGDKP